MDVENKILDQPVTNKEFSEFKRSNTETLDFIIESAVTKKEFKEYTDKAFRTFATKIDIQESEERLKQYVDIKFDRVMNGVDKMAKDVRAIREEQIMKVGRDDRQDDDIRHLDTRVITVEHRIGLEPVGP